MVEINGKLDNHWKTECQDCRHQKEFHFPDNKCNKIGCNCDRFISQSKDEGEKDE